MEVLREVFVKNKGFVLIVLIVLLVRSVLVDQYHVPSGSMLPTIQIGDRIFVNKAAYNVRIPFTQIVLAEVSDPDRGDVIVFSHPKTGTTMVKRLVGLPGDRIEIVAGEVFLNGLSEKNFIEEAPFPPSGPQSGAYSYEVPDDHYFFMGDNRENSSDSRVWGFVPRENLLGRADRVIFSLNNLELDLDRSGQGL